MLTRLKIFFNGCLPGKTGKGRLAFPERGFTYIEMIMAVLIVSVIALLAGPLLAVTIDAMTLHIDRVDLEQSAGVALTRMSREIRRLRNDESIVTATATQFEFVDADDVQIRYRLTGTQLMRSQAGGADQPLADNVQGAGISFVYYDDTGAVIASPVTGLGVSTDIRRIEIQLTFADSGGTHILPVETTIRPRNLRHAANLFA